MFGPNCVPSFSHRDRDFGYLYQSTIDLFKKKFGMNNEIVLLISGSGTLANEIVISSAKLPFKLQTEGLFSQRLQDTQAVYSNVNDSIHGMGVLYETSSSKLNSSAVSECTFMDCISAFPYYALPKIEVCTTVSSKQLGAITGLSMIILRDENSLSLFKDEEHSYLSLKKYYNKGLTGFTPNTPAMTSIQSLHNVLVEFDLYSYTEKILKRRLNVITALTRKGIPHFGSGPVITIPRNVLDEETVLKYNLYTNSGDIQLFLWSGSDAQYKLFLNNL